MLCARTRRKRASHETYQWVQKKWTDGEERVVVDRVEGRTNIEKSQVTHLRSVDGSEAIGEQADHTVVSVE